MLTNDPVPNAAGRTVSGGSPRGSTWIHFMRQFRLSLAAFVAGSALVAAHHAVAQQRTTATYNDWTVQCETQAGPPQQRVCDMAQVAQVQNQPFSRLAIP